MSTMGAVAILTGFCIIGSVLTQIYTHTVPTELQTLAVAGLGALAGLLKPGAKQPDPPVRKSSKKKRKV